MFGIDDALVAAVAPSLIEGGLGFLGIGGSNKASAKAAKAQMAFQREAAQNAHQWEVKDLRASGLNPILSAGGSGAPMQSGASYVAQNELGPAASSAGQIAMNKASLQNIKADTLQKVSNARLANTNAAVAARNVPLADLQNEYLGKAANTARKVAEGVEARWNPQHPIDNINANLGVVTGGRWNPGHPMANAKAWFDFFRGK